MAQAFCENYKTKRKLQQPPSTEKTRSVGRVSASPDPWWYLLGHESDDVGELLHHQVNALDAGLLQPTDLLLDYGLESHVGGEEAHADAWLRRRGAMGENGEGEKFEFDFNFQGFFFSDAGWEYEVGQKKLGK